MNFLKIFLIIIFLFSLGNSKSNEKLNEEIHLAISVYKFKDSYQKRLKSLILRLSAEIQQDLKIKTNVSYIYNVDDEINSFINYDKSNVIITSTSTYLENKELLKKYSKNPFFLSGDEETTQYYLVANKKSNIKTIKDLKNKSFITFNGYSNYNVWLDFLTLKELKSSYKNIISSSESVYSTKRLLLDVYFNKYDFTIVTKKVYNDMILLNPSLEKELTIIKKSKPIFLYGLGLVHKNTPKRIVDKINKIIDDESIRYKVKDMLSLIDRSMFKRLEFKDLKELESFWNEYKKLKAKNK